MSEGRSIQFEVILIYLFNHGNHTRRY